MEAMGWSISQSVDSIATIFSRFLEIKLPDVCGRATICAFMETQVCDGTTHSSVLFVESSVCILFISNCGDHCQLPCHVFFYRVLESVFAMNYTMWLQR